jgi:mannose-6-phosphate isomerase-like protein (cupin superfamily)
MEARLDKVNIAEKLSQFAEPWIPRIVGELNGQHVKVAKMLGAFDWHHHENEDELFLVLRGSFRMEFRDRDLELRQGEMVIVPKGVEHRPVADEECHILLFEPISTLNTGNVKTDKTVENLERI